jgi:hypothetical protein
MSSRPWTGPDPALLGLACFLLPVAVVHACYAIATSAGYLPLCVPYVDGCTSISATGRYGLAYFVFKAGILPTAVMLALFWRAAADWLGELGDQGNRARGWVRWLGFTGAAFLVLYTVALGHKGDFYNLMRRFGVTLYFGASYLAVIVLVSRLERLARAGSTAVPRPLRRGLVTLATVLLALGLGSIPVSNFVADKDPIENAIEWVFTLLLFGCYGLVGLAFRATGFRQSGTPAAAPR